MKGSDFLTLEEIKELIAVQLEPDALLDMLGVDMDDLVDFLEEKIEDNLDEVLKHLYD